MRYNSKHERNLQMFKELQSGATLKEISEAHRISSGRVREICFKIKRYLERPKTEYDDLSTRAQHILLNLNVIGKKGTKEALESGLIKPGKTRNCGQLTYLELIQWSGAAELKLLPNICPHCGNRIQKPSTT